MNKRGYFLGILFALIILSSTLISAAGEAEMARDIITRGINAVLGFVNPVLEKVLGDYETSEFFFTKVLLLFLLILISNGVLRKTPIGKDNKKVSVIVSIIISILAVRFIAQNSLIESILVPYGTLGVAITTILPLIIFFYFIHNSGIKSFGRKAAWIAFAVMFVVIWLFQTPKISPIGNWIYGSTIVIIGIAAFFDKDFHYYFASESLLNRLKAADTITENQILTELRTLNTLNASGYKTPEQFEKERDAIMKRLAKFKAGN